MNEPKKTRFTLKTLAEAGFIERSRDLFIHKSRLTPEELKQIPKKQPKRKPATPQEKTDPFIHYVRIETGIELTPEFRFDKTRKWRFDYANEPLMIAIEQEGGVYTKGRHTRPKGYINDMEKYNAATIAGWTLIRRTPDQMLTSETIDLILKVSNKGILDA